MKEKKSLIRFVFLFIIVLVLENQKAFADEVIFYDYLKEEVIASLTSVENFSIDNAKSFTFKNEKGERYFVLDVNGKMKKSVSRLHFKKENMAINKIAFSQNDQNKIRFAFRTNGKQNFDYSYDQKSKILVFSLKKKELTQKTEKIKKETLPVVVEDIVSKAIVQKTKTKEPTAQKRTEVGEVTINKKSNVVVDLKIGTKDGREIKIIQNSGKEIAIFSVNGVDWAVKRTITGNETGLIKKIRIAQHNSETVWFVVYLRNKGLFLNLGETSNGFEVALANSKIQTTTVKKEVEKQEMVKKTEKQKNITEKIVDKNTQIVEEKTETEDLGKTLKQEKDKVNIDTEVISLGSLGDELNDMFSEIEEKTDVKKEKFTWKAFFKSLFSIDTDRKDDNSKHEFDSKIQAEIKYKPNEKISVVSSAKVEYISREKGDSGIKVKLHEAYVDYQANKKMKFSVGKQIVRWGKTDQVSPLDNINPEDYSKFVIPDLEERKIPVLMAKAKFERENFKVEGVYIPFFQQSEIDFFGTDWAVFQHLKDGVRQMNPLLASFTDQVGVNDRTPEKSFENGEFGVRIADTFFGNMDFGFLYFNSFNDLGFVENIPNSIKTAVSGQAGLPLDYNDNNIEISYERFHTVGLSLETVVGPIGFRSETGYKSNENFLGKDLNGYKSPIYFFVSNADYTTENNWYLNAGVSLQHIANYDPQIVVDQNDIMFFGEINKELKSISSKIGSTFAYNLDGGLKVSPFFRYTGIENFEVEARFDIFSGPENTTFGRYDDNDQFGVCLKYFF